MNEKPKSEKVIDPTELHLMVMLTQGLLASGHFTELYEDADTHALQPAVRSFDVGKDWQENGFRNRFSIVVVIEARRLLDDIKQSLQEE